MGFFLNNLWLLGVALTTHAGYLYEQTPFLKNYIYKHIFLLANFSAFNYLPFVVLM